MQEPAAERADASAPNPHMTELWDGSFHLAYSRWLAGTGKHVGRARGTSETATTASRPSDGRSNHRVPE